MNTKSEFLENWEDYVNEFTRLGSSTRYVKTWDEIKRLREDMRKLVYEIADEDYYETIGAGI